MDRQVTPPSNGSFVGLLLKAVLNITQRLSDPIPLFILAICILLLTAAAIGGENLVIEIRILFGILAIVGIAAMLASRLLPQSVKGDGNMSKKRLQVLRKRLEVLNDVQFQEMIIALLTPVEQDELTKPVTEGSFLNDMDRWGRLDEVEQYLNQKNLGVRTRYEQ